MPRGYRLFILAAVGWLVLVGAAEPKHDRERQPHQPASGEQRVSAAPVAEPSHSAQSTETAEQQCVGKDGKRNSCTVIATQATVDQARDADWQTWAVMLGVALGAGTLAAAVIAAYWAKQAALHTESAANAAIANHNAFVESERGRLHILRAQHRPMGLMFTVKNLGNAIAEVTGVMIDTETMWPDMPSGSTGGEYGIKITSAVEKEFVQTAAVIEGSAIKAAIGYISYKTLGLNDCRSYFTCPISYHDGKPGTTLGGRMFQPDDT